MNPRTQYNNNDDIGFNVIARNNYVYLSIKNKRITVIPQLSEVITLSRFIGRM